MATPPPTLDGYPQAFKSSWAQDELHRARNIRPSFHKGLWAGLAYSAIDTYLFRGKAPWTFKNHADHQALKPKSACQPIAYPKPDGKVTFDRLSSVYISNTNHDDNQPCHLTLKDQDVPVELNLAVYDAPEQRYCPAGVYEIVRGRRWQQPAAADQLPKLRSLQDLRHQGPLTEYSLGCPSRWRWSSLHGHVDEYLLGE